jgi:hypothetical protein
MVKSPWSGSSSNPLQPYSGTQRSASTPVAEGVAIPTMERLRVAERLDQLVAGSERSSEYLTTRRRSGFSGL